MLQRNAFGSNCKQVILQSIAHSLANSGLFAVEMLQGKDIVYCSNKKLLRVVVAGGGVDNNFLQINKLMKQINKLLH